MATRQIKDAKITDGELIYFKGHAKATYMSDGRTVEDAINIASNGEANVQSDWNEADTTSDAYIKNKPTIPSEVTESTVSGWGFTKNTGTYSKPSGGIPKTDLTSEVQTSLSKADTALQSYTEQYKGTVTKVKINNEEKSPGESGVVDLGTVITSHQDISHLAERSEIPTNVSDLEGSDDLVRSEVLNNLATKGEIDEITSTIIDNEFVTASAITNLDSRITSLVNVKQDNLVSGTNIKTINGESILGSGDITVEESQWYLEDDTLTTDYPISFANPITLTDGLEARSNASTTNYTKGTSGQVLTTDGENCYWSNKQEPLVSGTNIKTINGESILGSGDITIEGGNSDANVAAVNTGDALDEVNVSYATTAYVDNKVASIDLTNYATTAYVDVLIAEINSVLENIING